MNPDVIRTMEAEEAELARKLEAVRQFLAAYRSDGERSEPASVKPKALSTPRSPRSAESRMDKFGPYGQRIVDFADDLLPGCNSNPVPTRALVERLEAVGISITGENKINSLSALLARSTKMKGWGRAGWTRAVPENGKTHELADNMVRDGNGAPEGAPDAGEVLASPSAKPVADPQA